MSKSLKFIHDTREDFATDVHYHHPMPYVWGRRYCLFWGQGHTGSDAIPHSPLRPRRRPLRRDGFCNACDHSLPCLLGVGGVPLRPGALPFFNVLMAASTSSEGDGQVKLGERWALCNFVVDERLARRSTERWLLKFDNAKKKVLLRLLRKDDIMYLMNSSSSIDI